MNSIFLEVVTYKKFNKSSYTTNLRKENTKTKISARKRDFTKNIKQIENVNAPI